MRKYEGYTINYGKDNTQGGHYLEVLAPDGSLVDAYHTHPSPRNYTYTRATYDKLGAVMLHYGVPNAWVNKMVKQEKRRVKEWA